MNKKDKLKEILRTLNGESIDFSAFDKTVATLRKSLEEKVAIPTLDKVNTEIENFRKKIDLEPLMASLEEVKKNMSAEVTRLSLKLDSKLKEQKDSSAYDITQSEENLHQSISSEIASIKVQIASLDMVGSKEIAKVEEEIRKINANTIKAIAEIKIPPDRAKEIEAVTAELDKTRIDLLNKINNRGGGNMNRQIVVGGNTSTLGKYNDINLKPGSNVTISYSNNDTTKRTDITIAATGGGGTTRSINTISTSQTAGATAGTDYVYICTVGVNLTLPTAVANTNLYTVKNTSTSSVLVTTTGVETIDASATVIMPVQYTAVDIISDSTNWNVT